MNAPVQNAELVANRLQQHALLQKRIAAIRAFGLPFYKPHTKQSQFHAAAGRVRKRMVRAGNRFGKSHMGCAEDCAWVLGERVWLSVDDPARTAGIPRHPVKGLIITTDWDKVDEIWTSERGDNPGKLWKFLPQSHVVSKKRNHSGAIETVEIKSLIHGGTSVLRFDTVKSFMSNPQGSESSDWDFIHVDEPCPEKMFKASYRGCMDRGGSVWFTLTPLREPWINDFFFPQDTGGLLRDDVFAINGSTYDNPYLSAEGIADFEATLNDEEKQCRLHGIPLHLAGLIYKAFRFEKHVLQTVPKGWVDFSTPPKHWPVYIHIDPHPQTPHAVLLFAVSPFGERFYFDDIFVHCSVRDLTEEILRRTVGRGYTIVSTHADPLAFIEHPITMTSMATAFADCGLPVMKATKALAEGILHVNQELKTEPQRMFFSPACRRTLWEIQRYCWAEGENKPVDVDDHMMENLYRQELARPMWIDVRSAPGPVENQDFPPSRFRLEDDEVFSTAL